MNRRPNRRLDDKLNILLIIAAAVGACVISVGNARGMAFGPDGRTAAAHVRAAPLLAQQQQQQQIALLAAAR